jgi:DNA (cytosine-5)-methyltransferase 1
MPSEQVFRAKEYVEPSNPKGRVFELFAGVGGFRVGLSRADLATVVSNQFEPGQKAQFASRCYEARFTAGEHHNMLIEDLLTKAESGEITLPNDIDVLVGGFPCQDYSVAKSLSTSSGIEGKKGVLWWQILRLMDFYSSTIGHDIPFVFLENVDRLLKSPVSQRGRDFAVMLQELMFRGYAVEWRVVSASDYGLPQRRIRVFILATKTDLNKKFSPGEAAQKILSTGILARSFPAKPGMGSELVSIELSRSTFETSRDFGRSLKVSPFSNAGFAFKGQVWTQKVEAHYDGHRFTLGDVLEPTADVPEEFFVSPSEVNAKWKPLKDGGSYDRVDKVTGFQYKYSEGKMTFPDDLSKPARTILTGEGGTSASRFKHLIQVDGRFRRLMPIELERLSGFPDNHTHFLIGDSPISQVKRAFFIGNALVVGLVERVGKILATEISASRQKR